MTKYEFKKFIQERIVLGEWTKLEVPLHYFKDLNDDLFRILYLMPDVKLKVSSKTLRYIEERRKALGLKKTMYVNKN